MSILSNSRYFRFYYCNRRNLLGAGDGIRVGLARFLNDNNDEAKLLAFQLEALNNHLMVGFTNYAGV